MDIHLFCKLVLIFIMINNIKICDKRNIFKFFFYLIVIILLTLIIVIIVICYILYTFFIELEIINNDFIYYV